MFTEEYLKECRNALEIEKSKSLQETNNWSHVDREQVHALWAKLYVLMSKAVDEGMKPDCSEFQNLVAQHYDVIKQFYIPSKLAYIGMSEFYVEDPAFRKFHDSFHPRLAEFLREGMRHFAFSDKTTVH